MLINEQRYCDGCHGVIVFGQKHVQMRIAGKSAYDAAHYHHRFPGDCWERQLRIATQRAPAQPPQSVTAERPKCA